MGQLKSWNQVAEMLGARRSRQQCYDRWHNQLTPRKQQQWTIEETDRLVDLVGKLGKSWEKISKLFPHRTCNQVKNRYNSWIRQLSNKNDQQVLTAAASFNNDSEDKDTQNDAGKETLEEEESPQQDDDQTDKPSQSHHKTPRS